MDILLHFARKIPQKVLQCGPAKPGSRLPHQTPCEPSILYISRDADSPLNELRYYTKNISPLHEINNNSPWFHGECYYLLRSSSSFSMLLRAGKSSRLRPLRLLLSTRWCGPHFLTILSMLKQTIESTRLTKITTPTMSMKYTSCSVNAFGLKYCIPAPHAVRN